MRVENETDEAVEQESSAREANGSQPGITFTCLSSSEKEPEEASDPFQPTEDPLDLSRWSINTLNHSEISHMSFQARSQRAVM